MVPKITCLVLLQLFSLVSFRVFAQEHASYLDVSRYDVEACSYVGGRNVEAELECSSGSMRFIPFDGPSIGVEFSKALSETLSLRGGKYRLTPLSANSATELIARVEVAAQNCDQSARCRSEMMAALPTIREGLCDVRADFFAMTLFSDSWLGIPELELGDVLICQASEASFLVFDRKFSVSHRASSDSFINSSFDWLLLIDAVQSSQ